MKRREGGGGRGGVAVSFVYLFVCMASYWWCGIHDEWLNGSFFWGGHFGIGSDRITNKYWEGYFDLVTSMELGSIITFWRPGTKEVDCIGMRGRDFWWLAGWRLGLCFYTPPMDSIKKKVIVVMREQSSGGLSTSLGRRTVLLCKCLSIWFDCHSAPYVM